MTKSNWSPSQARERAVRMVPEQRGQYPPLRVAMESIARKIGCVAQTFNEWIERHAIDSGVRAGNTASGQRNPEAGQRVFRPGGARPPHQVPRRFIDEHRASFGVGPVCKLLQIAPSGDWRPSAAQRNPMLRGERRKRDDASVPQVQSVGRRPTEADDRLLTRRFAMPVRVEISPVSAREQI